MLQFRRAVRMTAVMMAAALVLAACGDDADDPAPADDPAEEEVDEPADDPVDDEEAAEEPEPDPEPVEEGVTAVDVWIAFTDYRLDWLRDVASEFNDMMDGYQITVQGYDNYEILFDSTILAADQGNPPAIVQQFEAATTDARDTLNPLTGDALFTSIEEAIAGRDEIMGVPVVLDDVVDIVAAYYTLDGSFTSMPWNTSSAIMFANTDMMEAGGVTEIPSTWQEMEAACETIMGSDDAPSACITWPNHGWFYEQSVAQQGQDLVNNGNGRDDTADEVLLTSDASLDYVQWWQDMNNAGYYVYSGTQRDWDGAYNAFAAQQVPFVIYSSSDTTLLTNEGAEGGFEVVASFMPRNAESTDGGGNIIGGASMWLVDELDEDVTDVALAFLSYMINPENDADWHRVTGYIPVTDTAIDLLEGEGWFEENPNSRVASEQLAAAPDTSATAGALFGNFVSIRNVITEAIEDIIVNDLDVAERMGQANDDAQQLLEEYNLIYGG